MSARAQTVPTEDWRQIALLARASGQCSYELIRPVVLFGQSPAYAPRQPHATDAAQLPLLAREKIDA